MVILASTNIIIQWILVVDLFLLKTEDLIPPHVGNLLLLLRTEDLTIQTHVVNLVLSRMGNLTILTTVVNLLHSRTEDWRIPTHVVVDLLLLRTEGLTICVF